MNTTARIATAAIALFAAFGSFAAEGTQDFPAPAYQPATARTAAVVVAKDVYEATTAPVAVSTLERARVLAEAREAQRLGLTGPSETLPQPTAAQIEQIRIAGERAVAQTVAAKR
jgi:hypothetical protein